VSYLSASAVVIHHEEALYQVYAPPMHIIWRQGQVGSDSSVLNILSLHARWP